MYKGGDDEHLSNEKEPAPRASWLKPLPSPLFPRGDLLVWKILALYILIRIYLVNIFQQLDLNHSPPHPSPLTEGSRGDLLVWKILAF